TYRHSLRRSDHRKRCASVTPAFAPGVPPLSSSPVAGEKKGRGKIQERIENRSSRSSIFDPLFSILGYYHGVCTSLPLVSTRIFSDLKGFPASRSASQLMTNTRARGFLMECFSPS